MAHRIHSSGTARRAGSRLLVASLVSLSACATRPDAAWSSPDIGSQAGLLRGATVLVACEAPDVALRNICQDQLAGQASARGARPVFPSGDTQLVPGRPIDDQLLAGARDANASAIMVMTLRPVATGSESPFSLSIGGFGLGGRGSAIGGGITAPIGDARVSTGYAANGRVTSVATGRLVYTATASASPTDDVSRQLSTLSASVLDGVSRAGLF